MPTAAPSTLARSTPPVADLAKGALRRLAMSKLEPTPENYARAYEQEAGADPAPRGLPERARKLVDKLAARCFEGEAAAMLSKAMAEGRFDLAERQLEEPDASGKQLAALIDRLLRGVERRSKGWTAARKKDSLQRVLEGSAGDASRLRQRLSQLITSWESDDTDEAAALTDVAPLDEASPAEAEAPAVEASPAVAVDDTAWQRIVGSLSGSVQQGLPVQEANGRDLAAALGDAVRRIGLEGADATLADEVATLCASADRMLQHRHHLVDQLGHLCRDLTDSLVDLAEDESWAKGQSEAMRTRIDEGLTARGVKGVSELLRGTRERQVQIRRERDQARDSLKGLINQMLSELDVLGSQTGRFHESVGRYADVIERADSLESLAGVVREMVEESRTVQSIVAQTQERLQDEHSKASGLTQRVNELESELRRLSNEVSTDPLTQIANRRGLMQAFEAEQSRAARGGHPLAIGLLDVDNFKKLNDELGHGAGDEALKSLAQVVSTTLRPTDSVARYGGEEFVVLLPDTEVAEGQQILTRLQRSLSGGLFMHESKKILVTFSAGVTAYREGERIEDALERSDQALYEAKRTGKNRTCIG